MDCRSGANKLIALVSTSPNLISIWTLTLSWNRTDPVRYLVNNSKRAPRQTRLTNLATIIAAPVDPSSCEVVVDKQQPLLNQAHGYSTKQFRGYPRPSSVLIEITAPMEKICCTLRVLFSEIRSRSITETCCIVQDLLAFWMQWFNCAAINEEPITQLYFTNLLLSWRNERTAIAVVDRHLSGDEDWEKIEETRSCVKRVEMSWTDFLKDHTPLRRDEALYQALMIITNRMESEKWFMEGLIGLRWRDLELMTSRHKFKKRT
ncbi:hypothetical protein EK21DRAFT_94587 [Setomelanomma holmii]|uniref:Uncharacterized protein n=1 Tax=Setomelanomma holmii TaxID=210430 RepID=A0A9P4LEY1_9PLEO|nr:hypothetical protein EK21DRAFT_94587 [Setomelanomma holmii]